MSTQRYLRPLVAIRGNTDTHHHSNKPLRSTPSWTWVQAVFKFSTEVPDSLVPGKLNQICCRAAFWIFTDLCNTSRSTPNDDSPALPG